MPFDPQRDLKIEVRPDDFGNADLQTKGLSGQGFPELCINGIPEGRMNEAGAVLNLVADYIVNHTAVSNGERVGMPNDEGMLVVKLIEHRPPKKFLGLFGGDKGVQAVVDGWNEGGVPWIALSTILLWKAGHARDGGDEAEARRLLNEAFDMPRNTGEEPAVDNYNWNGAVAAERLAHLNDGDLGWMSKAVEASEQASVRVLGDPFSELMGVDEEILKTCATVLIGRFLQAPSPQDAGRVQMAVGPLALWKDGRVHLDSTVLPGPILALLGTEDVRSALSNEDLPRIVAGIVAGLSPLEVWDRCRGALGLYGTGSPMPVDLGLAWIPGTRLVSFVIAESIRCFAAGVEASDLRAYFGVEANPGAASEVRVVLGAFEQSLTEHYARALQP